LDKQTDNLKNIQKGLSKSKILIRSLNNINSRNTEGLKNTRTDPNISRSSFDNNRRSNGYFKRKTIIGKNTIITHANKRLSDVYKSANKNHRREIIKHSNELTMKNNNNIKVLCFTPSNKRQFSVKAVMTEDINSDSNKKSYYNSIFLNIRNDMNFKRVMKLNKNINNCVTKSSSVLPLIDKLNV
jgi:hypothetical protein